MSNFARFRVMTAENITYEGQYGALSTASLTANPNKIMRVGNTGIIEHVSTVASSNLPSDIVYTGTAAHAQLLPATLASNPNKVMMTDGSGNLSLVSTVPMSNVSAELMSYKGAFIPASTGLLNTVGNVGDFWVASSASTTYSLTTGLNSGGSSVINIGDFLIYNTSNTWDIVPMSAAIYKKILEPLSENNSWAPIITYVNTTATTTYGTQVATTTGSRYYVSSDGICHCKFKVFFTCSNSTVNNVGIELPVAPRTGTDPFNVTASVVTDSPNVNYAAGHGYGYVKTGTAGSFFLPVMYNASYTGYYVTGATLNTYKMIIVADFTYPTNLTL